MCILLQPLRPSNHGALPLPTISTARSIFPPPIDHCSSLLIQAPNLNTALQPSTATPQDFAIEHNRMLDSWPFWLLLINFTIENFAPHVWFYSTGPLPAQLLPGLLCTLGGEGQVQLPHLPCALPCQIRSQPAHQHSPGGRHPNGEARNPAALQQGRGRACRQ